MILLKELRTERNLTQIEVAKALKISRQVYANYENEINQPDCKMLISLAKFFEVSVDELLGISEGYGASVSAPISGGKLSETVKNDQERELLELFRGLSPYLQGLTLDTVRNWAGKTDSKSLHKKA